MKLLAVFVLTLAATSCADDLGKRIVSGGHAFADSYPFLASFQVINQFTNQWEHNCGASLITPTKLLTAAHCVVGYVPSISRVVLGVSNIHPNNVTKGKIARVRRLVVHPKFYMSYCWEDDIAIIHLTNSVRYSDTIKSVKLAKKGSTFDGSTCTIAGWGLTKDIEVHKSEGTYPEDVYQLLHTNITNIPNELCQEFLRPVSPCPIPLVNMCFYEEFHTPGLRPSACNGDSGGPALCGDNLDILAGITSGGKRCGWDPSVYVRVSEYLDWIKSN